MPGKSKEDKKEKKQISLNVKLQVQFIFGQLIGKLIKPIKMSFSLPYGDTSKRDNEYGHVWYLMFSNKISGLF